MWKTGRFVIAVVILSVVCISEAVDGGWGSWQAWGVCSVTCGGGDQSRTRACDNPTPDQGGVDCPGLSSGTQPCNAVTCPTPASPTIPPNVPIPLNHTCDSLTGQCRNDNMTCNSNNLCECTDGFYAHDDRTCLKRKKVDESCKIDTQEENECIDGAECVAHQCACVTDHFYEGDDKTCQARILSGDGCNQTTRCIDKAVCADNGTCQCEEHYYADSAHKCFPQKALGVSCVLADQCVNHASCQTVCKCDSKFYAFDGFCHPVQHLSGPCNESTPYMCLENAVCKSGRCQCNDNSFKNRATPTCEPTKRANITCDYFNQDERQCESDTKCVFRYWDPAPVCGCDIDHFFNGHVCQPRALAGNPCPYDPSYLHQSRLEIHHQCVENAKCSQPTLICECDENHYQRGQHCPPRISAGGTCDPWANYYRQCVDQYECAHGSCVQV